MRYSNGDNLKKKATDAKSIAYGFGWLKNAVSVQ